MPLATLERLTFAPRRPASARLATAGLALGLALAVRGVAASAVEPPPVPAPAPTGAIEAAHGAAEWRARPALQADLVLTMGGRRVLEARLLAETTGGRSRLTLKDGTVALFDGRAAHVWPADAAFKSARFHLLTWPYFLALPMKMADPGTHLEGERPREFAGRLCDVQKLTFDAGVGDTPRDWYLVFSDRADHRVVGAAYAMTFGQAADAPAPARPENAIRYDGFVTLEGVTLPTHWMFHDWMPDETLSPEPAGTVELANLSFVRPAADAFDAPAGSRVDPLPPPSGAGR